MLFVDKIFPREERKIFFTIVEGVILAVAILLIPAILKLIFSGLKRINFPGVDDPGWARFIFASFLFLVQLFFFFFHPACKKIDRWGRHTAGLLLIYLLGALLSPWITHSYSSSSFQELLKFLATSSLLFLLLYFAHRTTPSGVLRTCAYIGVFVATGEAFLGIAQYILQSGTGMAWLGEKSLEVTFPFALFELNGNSRWLFDSLPFLSHGEGFKGAGVESFYVLRSYGTFDHPNHFGGVLMIGVLLTCHLFIHDAQRKRSKVVFTLALIVQALALVTTYSRSAWLGVAVGVFILLGFRLFQQASSANITRKLRQWWRVDRGFLLALGVAALCSFCIFREQILHRCVHARKNFSYDVLVESLQFDEGRQQFLEVAKAMIAAHPWQGVGYNQFVRKIEKFLTFSCDKECYLPVHNIYLLVASEIGLPCACIFLAYIFLIARQGIYRALRSSQAHALFAIWIAVCLVGYFDNYFLTSQIGRLLLFTMTALILLPSLKPSR